MKQTIILGNIITVDEKRPFAKAAVVKNGVFSYIGSVEEAKKLVGADAKVLDYGNNYIYPGFLESHCHGHLAGYRAIGQANLMAAVLPTICWVVSRMPRRLPAIWISATCWHTCTS